MSSDGRPTPVPRRLADAPGLDGHPDVPPGLVVAGVTLDSRQVRPGDLYAALPGATTHGARFAGQAVERGAAAVLTDPLGRDLAGTAAVPVVVVPDPRGRLGELSAWLYGHPARAMTMLGVTGTNGKTTMTYLLAAGLAAAGHRPGIIGTIGVRIGDRELPSARTTPEAPDVHALLAVMREQGVTAVAMEVSSHALALGRVDGLRFDVAAFTNLSQDHLDFHTDMEDYYLAKASLFTPDRCAGAVVCVDDEWGRRLHAALTVPATTYAVTPDLAADWTIPQVETGPTGAWRGVAFGPDGVEVPLRSRLSGGFNVANALGSLAVLAAAGVDPAMAGAGLASCDGVPGRMQPVGEAPFAAFVDYAHTPDAVERAIAAVRAFAPGRVLVALGCGGDRDPGKRALMGRVAAEGADLLVVTDDNPRSEDPAMIRRAMLDGAAGERRADVVEIGDRRAAITHLVTVARPGDVVLVLGKGHEQGQEVAGRVSPFDDRTELAAAIAGRRA